MLADFSGDIIQVLVYLLIFGGVIVAQIVKHLKQKEAERKLRESRDETYEQTELVPPPEARELTLTQEKSTYPEVDTTEEEEEEKPEPESKPTPRDIIKELFEGIFEQQKPTIPPYQTEEPHQKKPKKKSVPKPRLQLTPKLEQEEISVTSTSQKSGNMLQHIEKYPRTEAGVRKVQQSVPLSVSIFGNLPLTDIQKAVIFAEVIGPSKSAKHFGLGPPSPKFFGSIR